MINTELMALIESFIQGSDTSLEAANRIEIILDDNFPDDDFVQEVVVALACYRPAGPPETLDEKAIQHFLIRVKRYLNEVLPSQEK
ncbi:hypothetical protein [Lysobacter capsici]|uniref:hypothetical protein n=1 Tax=Lysobacter capsici TaxID=435897 RepID=UPI00287B6574|nr:hypothetical protein [Lysobacter capsici]WND80489.1 hypothetical protein RJ610_24970 [Lysobacter capsici]WND85686.1 hypothetical protein RJ609_24990 [Lysobacter capsici]